MYLMHSLKWLKENSGLMMKSEEILKYLEKTKNENTTIQNLLNAAKAVLRGMFIAIQSSLKKKKKR